MLAATLAATQLRRRLGLEPRRWATPGAMARQLDAQTVQTPALDMIDAALVDVLDGQCPRLAVFLPPQEGKSQRVSRWFPTWALAARPDLRLGIASYELETARRWGRTIRDDIVTHSGAEGTLDIGLRLRRDSNAADRWQIDGNRGGLKAVGVGGALTGWPLDGLVIDDPLKDHEQANSQRYRDRVWDWWTSVARTRLAPGGWVVLVMTRWHEDDLAGRLLADGSEDWRVISIPALAERDDDPLGRTPGEWLASTRGRTVQQWQQIRRAVGEWVWASLYQQRPAPAEGGLFRRERWRYWTPLHAQQIDLAGRLLDLRDAWKFATVDLAASTKTSADWTVCSVWAVPPGGDALVLLDRGRARLGEGDHWSLVRPLVDRWSADVAYVERGMLGTTLVKDAVRAGLPVADLDADTDKLTRAIPASARVDAGTVYLPAGAGWLGEWIDEHAVFPNGTHDDQVDCLSYAVRVMAAKWNPMPSDSSAYRHLDAPAEMDFLTVPL